MSCPDEVHLLRMLDGTLSPDELAQLDAHLDQCRQCWLLVTDLVRARPMDPPLTATTAATQTDPLTKGRSDEPEAIDPGRRYLLLGHLASGGMGHVHRALDKLTGQIVALKHVRLRAPSTTARGSGANPLDALAREFRTLATLRHPNIVSVLSFGVGAEQRPYFTMELLEGAEPLLRFAARVPIDVRVDLLVQLLRALQYLHRRGILHRDLKPSNLLVVAKPHGDAEPHDASKPILKVLDFGLSTATDEPGRFRAAGTLPYMAPELLCGQGASEASDLYSVGILTCEMLAGRHPFGAQATWQQLVHKVLNEPPDLRGVPEALQALLNRMVAKSPEERLTDSAQIVRALTDATGLPVPLMPASARDSYLVAARLVGRERELSELYVALEDAQRGRGSARLIGGESGAGKSRLLDELRARALVDGVLVAEGQAVQSGGASYDVFRGLLSILALHVEVSDAEASVLGTLLPELGALLDREVQALPLLDAQSVRSRLVNVVRGILGRSPKPLLLILEDLQWADAGSLGLLSQILREVASRPLLIAASYRDDEAPKLPKLLPEARVMRLERFSRPAIAELCESMLGPSGRDGSLVDFMQRETEGNAYFIVEGMRVLAEESGGLAEVGRRGLPERILAGGMERVLDRRLARVPAEAQGLLRLAAVAGRKLDLSVLSKRHASIDSLVQACADAGVLGVWEQSWRFDHDKLRERVLSGLSAQDLRELHAQVAESLIETYPGDLTQAARVAHHQHEAGRLAEAAHFYALAGESSLSRGAPSEAKTMLERALALGGGPQQASSALFRARLWRMLAHARFALGELRGTGEAIEEVCAHAGMPLPTTTLGVFRSLGRQAIEQAARRSGALRYFANRSLDHRERMLHEEVLSGLRMIEAYIWLSRPDLSFLCTLWGLNLEEALSARSESTFGASLAFHLSHTPLWRLAQPYLDKAFRLAPPGSRAEIDCIRIQSALLVHRGERDKAVERAETAVSLARATGDDVVLLLCLFQLQVAKVAREDFPSLLPLCREMERLAARIQNPRYIVLSLIGRGSAELMLGYVTEAGSSFDRAIALTGDDIGLPLSAVTFGLAAQSSAGLGQFALAEERADIAMAAVRSSRWPLDELRYALTGVLDAHLSMDPTEHRAQLIEEALQRLRVIAKRFPSAEPTFWQLEGRYRIWSGQSARAAKALRRGVRAARRHGSVLEEAIASYWLGRLAQTETGSAHVPAGGAVHFELAHRLFTEIGLLSEAEKARQGL